MVWYDLVWHWGMTSEFICKDSKEILMLFNSKKFCGGGGGSGDIAIIATSSRSRSLRDLR